MTIEIRHLTKIASLPVWEQEKPDNVTREEPLNLQRLAVIRRPRYTIPMFTQKYRRLLSGVPFWFTAVLCLNGLCGCATLRFKPLRETRFINIDSEVLCVEYGEEKHPETLPNGKTLDFNGKVRLRLPTGKRLVLYQTFSAAGERYVSKDKTYWFLERGFYCIVYHHGNSVFEGFYCRK